MLAVRNCRRSGSNSFCPVLPRTLSNLFRAQRRSAAAHRDRQRLACVGNPLQVGHDQLPPAEVFIESGGSLSRAVVHAGRLWHGRGGCERRGGDFVIEQFCFQCGVAGKPEPASGVDDDGEPACAMHRLRKTFLQPLRTAEVTAIVEEVYSKHVEPAAPSPLQATEKEKADMADTLETSQLERAIKLKAQGKTVPQIADELGLPTWRFYQSSKFKGAPWGEAADQPRAPKKPRKVRAEAVPVEVDEQPASAVPVAMDLLENPSIFIRLRQSQVHRLIELLLQ